MHKIFALVLVLLCISLSVGLHKYFNTTVTPLRYRLLGVAIIVLAILNIVNTLSLIKTRTSRANKNDTSVKLLTTGAFRFSRNPIYLGSLCILFGVGFYFGSFVSFTGALLFFLVSNFWLIPREERRYSKLLGTTYHNYKQKVRRWL